MTTALPSNAMENSGSLTGHVLSRGTVDRPTPRSRVFVIVVVMLLVISLMGLIGLIAATTAGELVRSFFDSVLGG